MKNIMDEQKFEIADMIITTTEIYTFVNMPLVLIIADDFLRELLPFFCVIFPQL